MWPLGVRLVVHFSLRVLLRVQSCQIYIIVVLLLKRFWFTDMRYWSPLNIEGLIHIIFKVFEVFLSILVFDFSCWRLLTDLIYIPWAFADFFQMISAILIFYSWYLFLDISRGLSLWGRTGVIVLVILYVTERRPLVLSTRGALVIYFGPSGREAVLGHSAHVLVLLVLSWSMRI